MSEATDIYLVGIRPRNQVSDRRWRYRRRGLVDLCYEAEYLTRKQSVTFRKTGFMVQPLVNTEYKYTHLLWEAKRMKR